MIEFITQLDYKILAIVSAFFWALANIFARVFLKEVKAYHSMGISFLMVGSTLMILSPLFFHFEPTWKTILLLYLIAVIDAIANYFYFKTFEKTEANVATSVLSLSPIFVFAFGWLFLQETTEFIDIVLAFLIIICVVWLTVDFKNIKSYTSQTLGPALLASFFFWISTIPSKAILDGGELINSPTLYMFRATIIGMIALIFMRANLGTLNLRHIRMIWFQWLLAILTWVTYYYALTHGNAGITNTLSHISPVFALFIWAMFLSEKITLQKASAAILIAIFSYLMLVL